eukprot:Sspe_Gene.30006::Locus_14557_Transcript_1_1_Confidence_1.000_Length_3750::g.30006::m.30006/K10398/KIF11, EG5; kinesin family member 11
MASKGKQQNKEHVSVYVRARPLQDGEARGTLTLTDRDVAVKTKSSRGQSSYSFRRVFDTSTTQNEVFEVACKPMVMEMLKGFSCTIFAYGQTNSGKTHSMMGDLNGPEDMQGLTPRSCKYIFNELLKNDKNFTVRLSCVELYKEEFFDMLCPVADEAKRQKMRLFQDGNKVVMRGLEEVVVQTPGEVIHKLKEAISRRATAATGMNNRSSRSHFIATISVTIKEDSASGEEVFKIGRLHLVDLAGSESAKRAETAGTDRQPEAAAINKSLLTLGRVINSLSNSESHTPYRESALTRLLQDALGGKSKTTIITTISLAKVNMDETLSTLEYASCAKKIENDPQMNKMVSGNQLVSEYESELTRLKQELSDQRQGTGVFLSEERYAMLQDRLKELEKDDVAKTERIESLAEELREVRDEIDRQRRRHFEKNILLSHHQDTEHTLASQVREGQHREAMLHDRVAARDALSERNLNAVSDAVTVQEVSLAHTLDALEGISTSANDCQDAMGRVACQGVTKSSNELLHVAEALGKQEEAVVELGSKVVETVQSVSTAMKEHVGTARGSLQTTTQSLEGKVSMEITTANAETVSMVSSHTDSLSEKVSALISQFTSKVQSVTAGHEEAHKSTLDTMLEKSRDELVAAITACVSEVSQKSAEATERTGKICSGAASAAVEQAARVSEGLHGASAALENSTAEAAAALEEAASKAKGDFRSGLEAANQSAHSALAVIEERRAVVVGEATREKEGVVANIIAAQAECNAKAARVRDDATLMLEHASEYMESARSVMLASLAELHAEFSKATAAAAAASVESIQQHAAEVLDGGKESLRIAEERLSCDLKAIEAEKMEVKSAFEAEVDRLEAQYAQSVRGMVDEAKTRGVATSEGMASEVARWTEEVQTSAEETKRLTDEAAEVVQSFNSALKATSSEHVASVKAMLQRQAEGTKSAMASLASAHTQEWEDVTNDHLDTLDTAVDNVKQSLLNRAVDVVEEQKDRLGALTISIQEGQAALQTELQGIDNAALCMPSQVRAVLQPFADTLAERRKEAIEHVHCATDVISELQSQVITTLATYNDKISHAVSAAEDDTRSNIHAIQTLQNAVTLVEHCGTPGRREFSPEVTRSYDAVLEGISREALDAAAKTPAPAARLTVTGRTHVDPTATPVTVGCDALEAVTPPHPRVGKRTEAKSPLCPLNTNTL